MNNSYFVINILQPSQWHNYVITSLPFSFAQQWRCQSLMLCISEDVSLWCYVSVTMSVFDVMYQWGCQSLMFCISDDVSLWCYVSVRMSVFDVMYQWRCQSLMLYISVKDVSLWCYISVRMSIFDVMYQWGCQSLMLHISEDVSLCCYVRHPHWYIGNLRKCVLDRRSSLPWYSSTCLAVTSKPSSLIHR